MGERWDYRTLNRAYRLLHHNPEAVLIALGMTRYWLASDGISLDVAPFVAALENAAARKAASIRGALVRTGKFNPADLEGPVRQFAVSDSVASLPGWWESGQGSGTPGGSLAPTAG